MQQQIINRKVEFKFKLLNNARQRLSSVQQIKYYSAETLKFIREELDYIKKLEAEIKLIINNL